MELRALQLRQVPQLVQVPLLVPVPLLVLAPLLLVLESAMSKIAKLLQIGLLDFQLRELASPRPRKASSSDCVLYGCRSMAFLSLLSYSSSECTTPSSPRPVRTVISPA